MRILIIAFIISLILNYLLILRNHKIPTPHFVSFHKERLWDKDTEFIIANGMNDLVVWKNE